jgi:muconolactone delta-isomerase
MSKGRDETVEKASARDLDVQQRLETLRKEYGELNEQRIATERDKKNLEDQLSMLREKAQREYGTSDVEELRKLLEQRRSENEKMVADYQNHISGIKEELEKIEKGEDKAEDKGEGEATGA